MTLVSADDGTRPRSVVRPAAAVLLVVLGVGLCVLWKIASGSEQHSWDRGAVPPAFVQLTGGRSYAISIPDGTRAEPVYGVSSDSLSCSVSGSGIGSRALTLTAETADSKQNQQIASFVSPVTGQVQVSCARLPRVFVDDADDASPDWAGLLIWAGALALVIGLPLGLSVLRESAAVPVAERTTASESSVRPDGDDDEVE